MNNVIFVGSNPSNASPDNSAFHKVTRSGNLLHQWMDSVGISEAVSVNVSNLKTEDNKPLSKSQVLSAVNDIRNQIHNIHPKPTKIVALGKTAAKVLKLANVDFLEMPHPSGLNRKLNDKEYVKQELEKLKRYINERR